MGMYNDVFKKCPHCEEGTGYMQIQQVVLGFGGFNLDDPKSLNNLTLNELSELRSAVVDHYFRCIGKWDPLLGREEDSVGCGQAFRLNARDEDDARRRIIRDLCS